MKIKLTIALISILANITYSQTNNFCGQYISDDTFFQTSSVGTGSNLEASVIDAKKKTISNLTELIQNDYTYSSTDLILKIINNYSKTVCQKSTMTRNRVYKTYYAIQVKKSVLEEELQMSSQYQPKISKEVSDNSNLQNLMPENKPKAGGLSDVDCNIPNNPKINKYRYALIIGNEDYTKYQTDLTSEVNVDFAINDAETFSKYCKNVLGVSEENLFLLKNAIGTEIKREVNKISKMMMYTQGKAEVIFYYAGHGIPHETTKESYLMPVDVSAQNIEDGVKLSWLYSKLTEYNSKYVLVFLDACFTGGARNQGLLAARGVKIKPKENIIGGNCVAFTSSSNIQSSLPYKEKQHGMFTYHLLKKLQESKGNITLGELSDYLYENVALSSLKVNSKEQTPKTLVSPSLQDNWKQIKLVE